MRHSRRLSRQEALLWEQITRTVQPLASRPERAPLAPSAIAPAGPPGILRQRPLVQQPAARPAPAPMVRPDKGLPPHLSERHGLDAAWDKKLARAALEPDFTLDLHGHSLDAAHTRLDQGLTQALARGARVMLVIAGRPRPVAAADRAQARGVIRAKLFDWLSLSPHAPRIAAIRPAHRRHGGGGAVYLVLRRSRPGGSF